MTDIGCWKLSEGYAIRTYGSETYLSQEEFDEFIMRMLDVKNGALESFGEEYKQICEEYEARKTLKITGESLIEKLGLIPKQELVRRI